MANATGRPTAPIGVPRTSVAHLALTSPESEHEPRAKPMLSEKLK